MVLKSNREIAIELSSKIKSQSDCIASNAESVKYDTYTTTNPNNDMKNSYIEMQNACISFASILNRDAELFVTIADKLEKLDKDIRESFR